MKRKHPSAEFLPQKEQRWSNHIYSVVGLRGTQLRLCPVEDNRELPEPQENGLFKVEVCDSMRIRDIPLTISALVVGNRKYEFHCDTTIKDLRKKMRSMASRQVSIDQMTIALAKSLLPVFKKMWQNDEHFSHDRIITLCWESSSQEISATLNLYRGPRRGVRELEWLGKTQANLLAAFQYFLRVQLLVDPDTIEISYDRSHKLRYVSIQIVMDRERDADNNDCPFITRFDIEKRSDEDLEWQFSRGNPLPFTSLATKLRGKGSWDRPFPPLLDSFVFDSTEGEEEEERPLPGVPSLVLLCMAKVRSVDYSVPAGKVLLPRCLRDMIIFGRNDIDRRTDPPDDRKGKSPSIPSEPQQQ